MGFSAGKIYDLAAFVKSEGSATIGPSRLTVGRALMARGVILALAVTVVAFSIPIATVVGIAKGQETSALQATQEREAGFDVLARARAFERRLRTLRAHSIAAHGITVADRAQVERALQRLEDSVRGSPPEFRLAERLRQVETLWSRVSERRHGIHNVDLALGAAAGLEGTLVERSALAGEPDVVVADAVDTYLGALPTIDDRIDQERNLIERALAERRASPTTEMALEIFGRQWHHAYDSAIGSAEQIAAFGGSRNLLNELRRLAYAGSRFDAAERYVVARRAHRRGDAGLIATRASDVAREIDASASAAAQVALAGFARRSLEERNAFDHTLFLALIAWCSGLALTLATAYAVFRRERSAGARVAERLSTAQAQLEAIFEGSAGGVALVDEAGRVTRRNPALASIIARADDDVIGTRDPRFGDVLRGACSGYTIETTRDTAGKRNYFQSDLSAIATGSGAPKFALAIVRDVTEMREAEARLRFEARHDPVSRLPNRAYFFEQLATALALEKEACPAVAFLEITSDASPSSLGYTGDEILAALAARLAASVDLNDFVARFDGSTFVVLLHPLRDRAAAIAAVERLLKRLSAPVALGERDLHVSAIAGIAVADRPYSGPQEIVRDAEIAMYDARASGARVALFAPDMRDRSTRRIALVSQLRRALERDQLHLAFQPLVSANDGTIRGFEALLRWEHPELGSVSPAEFVPLAEEVGCVDAIGRWVLDRACGQLAAWRALGIPATMGCSISVNVAVRELVADDYATYVSRTLARHALAPRDVIMEITETTALRSEGAAARTLSALREAGLALAIDDFGTGYSSLCYLRDFAFDQLKIDGSFVRGTGDGLASPAIVTMLVALGKTLNVEVVAEGVETAAQAAELRTLGVDTLQGYYFGHPVAGALVADYLRGHMTSPGISLSAGLVISRATDLVRDHLAQGD